MKIFDFKIFRFKIYSRVKIFNIIKKCAEFSLTNIYLNYRQLIINKYKNLYLDISIKKTLLRDYLYTIEIFIFQNAFIMNCA